jgi:hypothetical protein
MNSDSPQAMLLREQLRMAARRLAARRKRNRRRLTVIAAGVAVSMLIVGGIAAAAVFSRDGTVSAPTHTESVSQTPPQTAAASTLASPTATTTLTLTSRLPTTPPKEDAAKRLGVFENPPSQSIDVDPAIAQSLELGGSPNGHLLWATARLLVSDATSELYAARTDQGSVCYWLRSRMQTASSCASTLPDSSPVSALVTEDGAAAATAGIATNAVRKVKVVADNGASCESRVSGNGFICRIPGSSAGAISHLVVSLRNGRLLIEPM